MTDLRRVWTGQALRNFCRKLSTVERRSLALSFTERADDMTWSAVRPESSVAEATRSMSL